MGSGTGWFVEKGDLIMKSYKFGSLDGVGMHYIVKVCSDMLSNEMDEVRHFKYNDYRWYVGVNVHDRLRDIFGSQRMTCTPIGGILGIDVVTSYAVAPNEIMLGIDVVISSAVAPNEIMSRVRPDYSEIDELKRKINSVYGLPSEYMNTFNLDVASLYPTEFMQSRQSGKTMTSLKILEENMKKLSFNRVNDISIKNVIFNNPATIVFWNNGTKTVVKAENEPFDPEKGLAMAISKKALGNQGNYYETFKKWLPKEESEPISLRDVAKGFEELGKRLRDIPLSSILEDKKKKKKEEDKNE